MAPPISLLPRLPRKVGGEVLGGASSHVPPRLPWPWVVGGRHPQEVASDRCTLLSPQELGLLQDYLLALTTDDHLLRCAAQVPPPRRPAPRAPVQAPPPGLHGALFRQPLPARVTDSGRAPFISDVHSKPWGQETPARICVFETKTTSVLNL